MENKQPPFARLLADEGETTLYPGDCLHLGRADDNEIIINDPKVSRNHAVLEWNGSGFTLRDLGSINGTYVNGQRLAETARLLRDNDEILLSQYRLLFMIARAAASCPVGDAALQSAETQLLTGGPRLVVSAGPDMGQEFPLWGETITIGRASREATWEIRLSDRSVSRPHARLELRGDVFYLLDLESANGTKLNGEPLVEPAPLKDGDAIGVGETMLVFTENPLTSLPPSP